MKTRFNVVLWLVLLVSPSIATAQQNTPDTIFWGDPRYLYPDSLMVYTVQDSALDYVGIFTNTNGPHDAELWHYHAIIGSVSYSPGQEYIIHGIAIPMEFHYGTLPPLSDTVLYASAPRAYLCQYNAGNWIPLDTVVISANIPQRLLSASAVYEGETISETIPVYELFFSQPHSVHDTFAVCFGCSVSEGGGSSYDVSPFWRQCSIIISTLIFSLSNPKVGVYGFTLSSLHTTLNYKHEVLLPILEPAPEGYEVYTAPTLKDVECILCHTAPRELRLALLQGNDATIQWFASEETPDEWELKVLSEEGDSLFSVRTEYNQHRIERLAQGNYSVAVRGICHRNCDWYGERTTFSDWSDPVSFHITQPLPPGGDDSTLTDVASVSLPSILLAPNPAEAFVDISSDCPVQQVVLRDATGKAVLRQACAEASVRISLASVPAGLYVAEIATVRGTVSRKLIVE